MSTNLSTHPLLEIYVWACELIKDLNADKVKDLLTHAPEYYYTWWIRVYNEAPLHVLIETGLICFILWLTFIRRTVDPKKSTKNQKLSKKETQWLIDTWTPEPLVPQLTSTQLKVNKDAMIIDKMDGREMRVRGIAKSVINFSSYDFLSLSVNQEVKEVARKALEKYGCGSCGPRGFYGTIDKHLEFEAAISKFMGTQEAIAYSDGSAAVASTIPAFSKKGDLILVDDACNEPILTGLKLSRSTIQFFKHNDMADLASVLQSIAEEDKRLKRDTMQQRRFIVVEGLYRNTGDICPLTEIMALKRKYFYRVVLDESLSFGTLGRTGRGVTELFNVNIADVDIINVAMDTALASVGGVCIGTREIVDHQRLSGAGYCFSASSPPLFSAAAICALSIMEKNPTLLDRLRQNSEEMYKALHAVAGLKLLGEQVTPVMHLALDPPLEDRDLEADVMMSLARECVSRGAGVCVSKFAMFQQCNLRVTLRANANATMTSREIQVLVSALTDGLAVIHSSIKQTK